MGLFGTAATPYEIEVEKATDENRTAEDWALIIDICDKIKTQDDAKNYLRAIVRRLSYPDPHVGLYSASLLDACVSNCGKVFHLEVASREFEGEYTKLLKKADPAVQKKLKQYLKKWAENEFKADPQLDLIPSLYNRLRESGTEFPTEPLKKIILSKDPNVVQSQDEEDQIAKAIELSLKETSSASPKSHVTPASTSLYPTNLTNASYSMGTIPNSTTNAKEPRKVRALHDFEAAEDNELTFSAGEILFVTDDSNANWWRGTNHRGEGLFPANFVTPDLSMDTEKSLKEIKELQQMENNEEREIEPDKVEIDEGKIDRLLHLLHEADSTNPDSDSNEMLKLEREVNGMGPLIDMELEKVDRKHAQLTQLSSDLVEALNLYHTLMREPTYVPINKASYGYPTQPMQSAPGMYNGTLPHPTPQFVRPYMSAAGPAHVQDRPPNLPPPGLPPHVMLPPNMMPAPLGSMPHNPQHNVSHGQTASGPPSAAGQMHSMPPMPNQPGLPNYGVPNPPPGFPPNALPQMNGTGTTGQPANNFATPPNQAHIM